MVIFARGFLLGAGMNGGMWRLNNILNGVNASLGITLPKRISHTTEINQDGIGMSVYDLLRQSEPQSPIFRVVVIAL